MAFSRMGVAKSGKEPALRERQALLPTYLDLVNGSDVSSGTDALGIAEMSASTSTGCAAHVVRVRNRSVLVLLAWSTHSM